MSMLTVDDLRFELKRSGRRKTMQITVERDGQLIIMAPPDVSEEGLSAFVREKKFWIYTKLAEKDRLQAIIPKNIIRRQVVKMLEEHLIWRQITGEQYDSFKPFPLDVRLSVSI